MTTSARTRGSKKPEPPPADDTPADTPPVETPKSTEPTDEFDALLAQATLTDKNADGKHRPTVDVPEKIVIFAQKLYNDQKAAQFPVADKAEFDKQKLMWQSAADKTSPQSSATVTEIKKDGKLTGLRVSFGARRGKTGKRTKKPTTPPANSGTYMEQNYGDNAASTTQDAARVTENVSGPTQAPQP